MIAAYTAKALRHNNSLHDISITTNGKTQKILGAGGKDRELRIVQPFLQTLPDALPVLLGSGVGFALVELLTQYSGPVAVVDTEKAILEASGLLDSVSDDRILWITEGKEHDVLAALTKWQCEHNGKPLTPLAHPFYLRINRQFYGAVRDTIMASTQYNFWEKAAYPKFTQKTPRLLLITSKYFLIGEIIAACERLNIPHKLLKLDDKEVGQAEFVEQLLKAVLEFKPDFIFTINHLGIDREGVLTDLLQRLELPIASWFVDNPHLILYMYNKIVSPWTAIFTWDTDNIPSLYAQGFEHVHYLPLGTDPYRFIIPKNIPQTHPFKCDVSFVGNSMEHKVASRLRAGKFSGTLLSKYTDVAAGFAEHSEHSVRKYLQKTHPSIYTEFEALESTEQQLTYEAMITWEATRQYRAHCVEQILPFSPLIVGDDGWLSTFKNHPATWQRHPEINYYSELPTLYPLSTVNFNCTSKQMKGAVNQRVFDVPATESFILTDWREQIENLFEPQKEVICYKEPEEVGDLLRFYQKNTTERIKIAKAARKRIMAEHTYEHRVLTLIETMRHNFS